MQADNASVCLLFDGKLARAAILAFGLVNTSIGPAADETDNLVAFSHSLLVIVPGEHGLSGRWQLWLIAGFVLQVGDGREVWSW